jgi:hypothetical protein
VSEKQVSFVQFYEDAVMIRVKVEEVLGDSEAWVHYIDFGNR